MSIESLFDLLDHAIEPDAWECDGDWEYRAMHWRPSSAARGGAGAGADADAAATVSAAASG